MVTRSRRRAAGWWRLFLAAVAVVVVGLLGAGTSSADTLPVAETRVGAIAVTAPTVVGFDAGIWASQHQMNGPARAETMAATGVAAKTESSLVTTASRACSFSGATLVLMGDGSKKPIGKVKVGDKVLATDPETGEQVAKKVEHVFVHEDTVTDLVIDGQVISTTEDHPFWSVTDQRFERADTLEAGDKVLAADGGVITVSGLDLGTVREALAYNLAVEGIHTYHVGDGEILVHNTCGEPFLDDVGEAYVRSKHTVSGESRNPSKSYFYDEEDLSQLADDAGGFPASVQGNGNCLRVCRPIGIDVETNLPTSTYSVITDRYGGVVTMHPGNPR